MTTQATHTPGPWYVLGDYVSSKSGGEVVCPIKRIRSEDLSLIAAAPDLLAALRNMLCEVRMSADTENRLARLTIEHAEKAIAKAEGRAGE